MQLIYLDIQRLTAHNVIFSWSEDLELAFQAMKRAIQEALKLSPINTRKKLYAFVMVAYILAQRKDEDDESKGFNIISVDSTTVKRAHVQYSPFMAEALGLFWFLKKKDFFTRGVHQIIIFHDAKNMG